MDMNRRFKNSAEYYEYCAKEGAKDWEDFKETGWDRERTYVHQVEVCRWCWPIENLFKILLLPVGYYFAWKLWSVGTDGVILHGNGGLGGAAGGDAQGLFSGVILLGCAVLSPLVAIFVMAWMEERFFQRQAADHRRYGNS
jgi:hypothetical protein